MASASATTPLNQRIERSLQEGRLPQALELAKQLQRYEPGPAALSLLRRAYLGNVQQHVGRQAFRMAHALLTEAEQLPGADPAWWEQLAELRADLGDCTGALQLLERIPESTARPRILGRLVDRAMRDGPTGRQFLPNDLKTQFDLVRKAFAEYEAGRDDPAREALNGVGLASPFLDWKLFLRGLMAWAANDTPRALENWSRLNAARLPAALAAPFRYAVDKAFAASLPATRQGTIARQADALMGGAVDGLRRLRKQLAREESIAAALETMRGIVPELNRTAPHLMPRLANIVYWVLVSGGHPDDLHRYNRLFGPPVDDPSFFRLQALVMETIGRLDQAHAMWGKYEDWIANAPKRWPEPQAGRARALILTRMGQLAKDWHCGEGEDDDPDDFLDMFRRNVRRRPEQRTPLQPTPEQCYRRACELAPDWVSPVMDLLRVYAADAAKAQPVLEDALQRFPGHLEVLTCATQFFERLGDMARAHETAQRALAANPLDRDLRRAAAGVALHEARRCATNGEFAEARAALQKARHADADTLTPTVLALATIVEARANDPEAAQVHRAALDRLPSARLASAYRLTVEAVRLKLKKKEATPYQSEFAAALVESTDAGEWEALVDALAQYRADAIPYRGLKTHEKKIQERIYALSLVAMKEDEAIRIGLALHRGALWKTLQALGEVGQYRFHGNAYFEFFQAEALLARRRTDHVNYRIGSMYMRVQDAIERAKNDRYRRLQELLDLRKRATPDLDAFLSRSWRW